MWCTLLVVTVYVVNTCLEVAIKSLHMIVCEPLRAIKHLAVGTLLAVGLFQLIDRYKNA